MTMGGTPSIGGTGGGVMTGGPPQLGGTCGGVMIGGSIGGT
jgi:hypothetical protein